MKIKKGTTVSDIILLIHGDKQIRYFYMGFWFWKKKELECGYFLVDGTEYSYKVVDNQQKSTVYYTDRYMALCNFLSIQPYYNYQVWFSGAEKHYIVVRARNMQEAINLGQEQALKNNWYYKKVSSV